MTDQLKWCCDAHWTARKDACSTGKVPENMCSDIHGVVL